MSSTFSRCAPLILALGVACSPSAPQPAAPEQGALHVVVAAIGQQLGIPASGVDPDAPLAQLRPQPDELDLVEILMRVEKELGVEITDEELAIETGSAQLDVLGASLTARAIASAASR